MIDPGHVVRFEIGAAFPADDRLSRWMTVCAMALNDLLLVNRWLVPRLTGEEESVPHETFYLGRLAGAHLFEAATFLRKSDRQMADIREFAAGLDPEAQDAYAALRAVGDGGAGIFYEQLKHARNTTFHYQALVLGDGEAYESLKKAMEGHAEDEEEKDLERGEIRDFPPPITGFRATFADDIAVERMLPGDTEAELNEYIRQVSSHIACFLKFVRAALNAYTASRPRGTWRVEETPPGDD